MAWDGYDNGYGYDTGYGYDAYGYQQWEEPEDPEVMRERLEQEKKERKQKIEGNRLYKAKPMRQKFKEESVDLERSQLFLVEIMIESLELESSNDWVEECRLSLDNSSPRRDPRQLSPEPACREHCRLSETADSLGQRSSAELSQGKVTACRSNSYVQSPVTVEGIVSFLDMGMEICADELYLTKNTMDTSGEGVENTNPTTVTEPTNKSLKLSYTEVNNNSSVQKNTPRNSLFYTTSYSGICGKSCLFTAKPFEIIEDLARYPTQLLMIRRLLTDVEPGCLDRAERLGTATLWMPYEFSVAVIQSCKERVSLPVTYSYTQILSLQNSFERPVGSVTMTIKLSSFGPAILTSVKVVGDEHRYILKTGAVTDNFRSGKETPRRSEIFKPMLADVEKILGCCPIPRLCNSPSPPPKLSISMESDVGFNVVNRSTSLRLPVASDMSLCRDVQLSTRLTRRARLGNQDLCDWHYMVSHEIRSSPIGNCGCMDRLGLTTKMPARTLTTRTKTNTCTDAKIPSRVEKLSKVTIQKINIDQDPWFPNVGGEKPEKGCCGCNCEEVREQLRALLKSPWIRLKSGYYGGYGLGDYGLGFDYGYPIVEEVVYEGYGGCGGYGYGGGYGFPGYGYGGYF